MDRKMGDLRERSAGLEEDFDRLGLMRSPFPFVAGVQYWRRMQPENQEVLVPRKEDVRAQGDSVYELSALTIEMLRKTCFGATAHLIRNGRRRLEWLRPANLGDLKPIDSERIVSVDGLRDGICLSIRESSDGQDDEGRWQKLGKFTNNLGDTFKEEYVQRHSDVVGPVFEGNERKVFLELRGHIVAVLDAETTATSLRRMTADETAVWNVLRKRRRGHKPREYFGTDDHWGRPYDYWRHDLQHWRDESE